MQVILSALCDFASVTADGKLNALGIFNQVNWTGPGTVVPMMFGVFVVEPDEEEYGRRVSFHMALYAPDGREVLRTPEGQAEIPQRPAAGRIQLNQVAGFAGVQFAEQGNYQFVLNSGNVQVGIIELPAVAVGSA